MSTETTLYDSLRNRLVSGEFKPEQRLKSDDLRGDYGVSASTIREVLFRLSTVGLVDSFEQRGFRVPEQSTKVSHDLTRMRIMLECEGACLSIRYGGVAWEARLNAAHYELKHIETRVRTAKQSNDLLSNWTEESYELLALWTEAELKFHRMLIEKCGSEVLKDFHLQVYYRFRQQLITCDRKFVFIPANIKQHQKILDAVLDRNEALVNEHIRTHLSRHLTEE